MRKRNNIEINQFLLNSKYLNLGSGKHYMLKTYGCQGNLADSEKIAGILELLGFEKARNELEADFVLFNTCAIRENAEERVYGELGRFNQFKKRKPDMIIGICGCMPQEEKTITTIKKKFPQINIVFGTHNIASLPEYLYDAMMNQKKVIDVLSVEGDIYENIPMVREHSKKAWVNIMYGCDEFCTYCIVPYTRGKERSRRPKDIIDEVEKLAQNGYVEVTLLGQNVNAYGKDFTDFNYTFSNLLEDLNQTSIKRIRFTTSHPRDLDDATIEAMALGGNIMPHLHLPVQSGSNEVLKRMNRKSNGKSIENLIKKLRKEIPDVIIRTTVMVGFPGETAEDYEELYKFVEKTKFDKMGAFSYSKEENTPAEKLKEQIHPATKKSRYNKIMQLQQKVVEQNIIKHIGKELEVLIENNTFDEKYYIGRSYMQAPEIDEVIYIKNTKQLEIGQFIKCKIIDTKGYDLIGEIVNN